MPFRPADAPSLLVQSAREKKKKKKEKKGKSKIASRRAAIALCMRIAFATRIYTNVRYSAGGGERKGEGEGNRALLAVGINPDDGD